MSNFPEIAFRTFMKLKHDFNFLKITKNIVKRLKKHRSPLKRARLVHKEVDLHLKELLKDDSIQKLVSCKSGCQACCHTQVSVTQEEADLLASRVVDGVEIDLTKLLVQSKAGNSSSEWYKLNYELRGCLFLDQEGKCKVYDNRPSVCRTNYVISDPSLCQTKDGGTQTVRLLNTYNADMALMAGFQSSKENGVLPYMLLKSLDNVLEENKDKDTTRKNTPEIPQN